MKTSYRRRVAKGARLLDKHISGWRSQISLETLNLGDSCHCILGQLTGSYHSDTAAKIVSAVDSRRDAGFTLTEAPLTTGKWDRLTAEWLRQITKGLGK